MAFGGSAGEDHFIPLRSDHGRHLIPGLLDGLFRPGAIVMGATALMAQLIREEAPQDLPHLGFERGGGVDGGTRRWPHTTDPGILARLANKR